MIFYDKKAIEVIKNITKQLYDSVSHTLGPNGSNSLILKDYKPIITNDGVSIINSIQFEKEEENMILSLLKECVSNTENKAGDGTTSTMILLYNIIKECLERIDNGENPIILRSKLLSELKLVLEEIPKYSTPIKEIKDIKNIALISTGGYIEISELLLECFEKTDCISLELDENINNTIYEKLDGLIVNMKSLINKEKQEINSKILIALDNSVSPEDLKALMELKRQKDFPLLLIIGKVNEEINNLLNLYSRLDNLYLYNLPEFGETRNDMIKAISYLTNSAIINSKNIIAKKELKNREDLLGDFKGILSNGNIIFTELKESQKKYLSDNMPYKKTELEKGLIKIKVGGPTEAQAKEMYYRIEDAINSIKKSLEKGYVSGAGSVLYHISNNLELDILNKPLKSITNKLLENNALNIVEYEEELNKAAKDVGFNALTNKIENLKEVGIIDPTITVMSTLENAGNTASSIITIKNINLTK